MGGLICFAFVAIAFGLILRFGWLPRRALELTGAVLLIGIAGYTWQGHPNQRSSPAKPAPASFEASPALIELRREMNGERFGYDSQYLDYADTVLRYGKPDVAVAYLKRGLRDNPRSPALWTGLGNALVAHNAGMLSPASTYAFQHAHALSPQHPGPPFFYGLALASSGRSEEAVGVWRRLAADAPADARWRPKLTALLTGMTTRRASP